MNLVTRGRRLRAGVAGLSVVSALGAAVGLGLTTHPSGSQTSQGTASDTVSNGASRAGGVSSPSSTTPHATTSGS